MSDYDDRVQRLREIMAERGIEMTPKEIRDKVRRTLRLGEILRGEFGIPQRDANDVLDGLIEHGERMLNTKQKGA